MYNQTNQQRNWNIIFAIMLFLVIMSIRNLHGEAPPTGKPTDWNEPQSIRTILEEYDNSLPVGLSHVVAYKESRFKKNANNGQDRGLMQINRYYQDYIAWKHAGIDQKSFKWNNAEHSAIAGCNYLAYLIDRFGGSVYFGIVAYNWGEGNLSRITSWDDIPDSVKEYADSTLFLLDLWDESW